MIAFGQALVFSRSLDDGNPLMSQFDQMTGRQIGAALIFDDHADLMTLPQGIALLTGRFSGGDPSVVMAAVVWAILPVLIVFVAAQRWIIEALTRYGIKG